MSSLDEPIEWERVEGLPKDQAYAFLAGVGDEVLESDEEPLTAAAMHTGAMIALIPSDEDLARLAYLGGEPEDDLHLTLAFLGEAALISDEARSQIVMAASRYFSDPITTEAFSVNVFNPHSKDTDTALVLGIRGEDLVGPRGNVMSAVRGLFAMPPNHEPWIPHVTLAYTDDTAQALKMQDRLGPITFDKLRFAFGGEVTDVHLGPVMALTAAFWDKDKHPRDDEGRFRGAWKDAASGALAYIAAPNALTLAAGNRDHEQAIEDYQLAGHKEINVPLRQDDSAPMEFAQGQRTLDGLDALMADPKARLQFDSVVLRGAKDPSRMFGSAWSSSRSNVGLTWRDPAFVSTTTDQETADHFTSSESDGAGLPVKMRILAPKGTRALRMESRNFKQEEILLDRSLTYRIVKQGKSGNAITLDVEVVPEGGN